MQQLIPAAEEQIPLPRSYSAWTSGPVFRGLFEQLLLYLHLARSNEDEDSRNGSVAKRTAAATLMPCASKAEPFW